MTTFFIKLALLLSSTLYFTLIDAPLFKGLLLAVFYGVMIVIYQQLRTRIKYITELERKGEL